MAHKVVYCLPAVMRNQHYAAVPGINSFRHFSDLYGAWVLPIDRTGVMRTPIRSASLFPVPAYRKISTSYEDLCNNRAIAILKSADVLHATIYLLYSGGIDSTCVLVSLLKNATSEQKKNIVVLLSHESIAENPRFYDEHIRGKLRTSSSITFPELIGTNDMLLSAEHNDLVMGSEKIGKMIARYGAGSIHEAYGREKISALFADMFEDRTVVDTYMNIFERMCEAAPIDIRSNMEFLWWINFAFKWQACYYYMLLFSPQHSIAAVDRIYLDSRFISFYNTDDFQLWSMNNLDKRIRDTWKSYKWICKDIIYDYNKDAEYRDHKTKNGSLLWLVGYNPPQRLIDERLQFSAAFDLTPYLQTDNDFNMI